jgi:hypothetical protein
VSGYFTDSEINTMLTAKALDIDVSQADPEQDIPQQYSEEDEFHDKPADRGRLTEESFLMAGEADNLQGLANLIEKLLAGDVSDIDVQSIYKLTENDERIPQEKCKTNTMPNLMPRCAFRLMVLRKKKLEI